LSSRSWFLAQNESQLSSASIRSAISVSRGPPTDFELFDRKLAFDIDAQESASMSLWLSAAVSSQP
jgi:hypothetical protein